MNMTYELTAVFRHLGGLDVPTMLAELHAIQPELIACSPLLDTWLLKGNTKHEAQLYEVFDPTGPTTAATVVLTQELKGKIDPRIIGMWNGRDDEDGASLQYIGRPAAEKSQLRMQAEAKAFAPGVEPLYGLLRKIVSVWKPSLIHVETSDYDDKKVFEDRPGVGWMLYLPRVLTVAQVPEARALVPVMGEDAKGKKEQTGTIVVSVTDAPFSDENPEHVKIANAIEIRLVDQDLLPRYADL